MDDRVTVTFWEPVCRSLRMHRGQYGNVTQACVDKDLSASQL